MKENLFFNNWYYFLEKDKNRLSLMDDHLSFSREEVEILSGKVYSYLNKNNIGKEDVVMISMNRSSKVFIVVLGILKAAAVYFIVDNSSASKRSEYIKENSKAKLVIDDELFLTIENQEEYLKGYKNAGVHDGAFVVYTSGSTGKPKGILHERGNIDLGYESAKHAFENDKEKAHIGVICPLQFVAASLLFNIYLNCGGCLYIADNNKIKNVTYLIKSLLINKISDVFMTPELFKMVDKLLPKCVKFVYLGGEACVNVFSKKRTLYNVYVSSESGYVMDIYKLNKAQSLTPIGVNNNGYLRIEDGQLIAKAEYTRGYVDAFLNEGIFKNGEYYTGDLGKEDNGYLYVTGRANEMIKINGNRIEPQEIENIFKSIYNYPCVVKANTENSLALFYVGRNELDINEVNKKLSEYLPSYTYISYIRKIKKFSFSETGKIDKSSLIIEQNKKVEYIEPKTKFEKKLVRAIEKELNIKKVSMLDDFFELGGDSLSIISIVSKLKIEKLEGKLFYEGRTIKGIVDLYNQININSASDLEIELEQRKVLFPLEYPQNIFYDMWNVSNDNISVILHRDFVLGKVINIKRFQKVLNNYLRNSSTFNARIILNDDKVPCFKYSPEMFKEVEILRMKESDASKYIADFPKPMNLLNELPYRFKLIKTEKNKYFLLYIHHSIIDGEGIYLFIKDIFKAYFNLPHGYSNFFSYLKENHDEAVSENSARINKEMEIRARSRDWNYVLEDEGEEIKVIDTNINTGIKLNVLKAFLKKKGLSRGALFCSAMALAKAKLNKNPNVTVPFISSNRLGVENHGGVRYKPGLMFLEIDKSEKFDDFLKKAKREYDDAMAKARVYNSVLDVYADCVWCCNDLNDMYINEDLFSPIIKELPLLVEYVQSDVPDRIKIFYFYNYNNELFVSLHLDRGIVSKKLQDDYYNLTIEAIKRIIDEDETLIDDYLSF